MTQPTMNDASRLIESRMPYSKQRATVLGKSMAYVDTGGTSDPIVFLHGNLTSSYMWRNIMPHMEGMARCIAIDNIGQGDSEKLEKSGPGSYRLAEHQRHIDELIDYLDLGSRITFMLHGWGGPLGFTWARNNPDRVRALAFTQTVMGDVGWDHWPPEAAQFMRRLRSEEGENLVLEQNLAIEKLLPSMVIRELPPEVLDEYRRPYLEPGEGRRATLAWPREQPVEGEPADVLEVLEANAAWLKETEVPKFFVRCEPETTLKGDLLALAREFPNLTEVTVRGLHCVHEDSPHEIGEALAKWYRRLS